MQSITVWVRGRPERRRIARPIHEQSAIPAIPVITSLQQQQVVDLHNAGFPVLEISQITCLSCESIDSILLYIV
jgi:hypothetical protein